jgi:hypothetical protein
MKVQLFKYTTTEEFNERIQSVLNVGQEPVLNMKIQKIFYSKTSEAFKKIQSSQEKGSIHAPDRTSSKLKMWTGKRNCRGTGTRW